jgi:TIR domain
MPGSIFVSYSHQDGSLVKPVVGLLRATDDIVFQDVDSIKPGRRWRGQIEEAIYAAYLVIVFWCYHSSKSAEVRAEYC